MPGTQLILTDYACYDELGPPDDKRERLVVSFDRNVVEVGERQGYRCRLATDYVEDTNSLVSDEDLEHVRACLSSLWEYEGVSVGHLIQNSAIFLFARQFIRQFRLVESAIEAESPAEVSVYTDVRPQYQFLEVGDSNLYLPLVRTLCSQQRIPFDVSTRRSLNLVTDRLFRLAGPRILRFVDNLTDRAVTVQDRQRPKDADVLLHLANKNNLDVVAPVVDELEDRGRDVLIVSQAHGYFNWDTDHLDTVRSTFPSPVRSFESFQDRALYGRTKCLPSLLSERWADVRDDSAFTDQFVLDDVPIWEAVEDQLRLYFALQLPRAGKYVETCRQILDTVAPRVVLHKADGPTPTRTMVNVAQSRNTPTVLVQHGLQLPSREYVPDADNIAAWGEQSADFFERKGVDESRLVVTGAPHFDYLQTYTHDDAALRDRLGIADDNTIVTHASQPFNDAVRKTLVRATVDGVAPLEDVSLVLRPHPREDVSLHERYADRADADVVVAPDENVHDLVLASDLLLAVSSTVILESSLLETPVALLTFTDEGRHPFYAPKNGFPEIDAPDEVGQRVTEYLSRKDTLAAEQPSFGRQFAHNEDSGAARRVVDLIDEVGGFEIAAAGISVPSR